MREPNVGDLVIVVNTLHYNDRIGVLSLPSGTPEDPWDFYVELEPDDRFDINPAGTIIGVNKVQVRVCSLSRLGGSSATELFSKLGVRGLVSLTVSLMVKLENTNVTFGRFLELHLLLQQVLERAAELDENFKPVFSSCRRLARQGSIGAFNDFFSELREILADYL